MAKTASAGARHEGGCLCGRVRYRAVSEPVTVNHCHCEMCRRASGAAFVTWATFRAADVSWTKDKPASRRSSDFANRGFCLHCGGALTWQRDSDPTHIDIAVGSLDNPDAVRPKEHLWAESRVSWLHLHDDLPRYRTDRTSGLIDD